MMMGSAQILISMRLFYYYRSLRVGNVTLVSWIEPYTFEWNANVALCLSVGGLKEILQHQYALIL